MKKLFKTCTVFSTILILTSLISLKYFLANLIYTRRPINRFSLEIKKHNRNVSKSNTAHQNRHIISNNFSFFAGNIRNIPEETFLNNFSSIFKVNKSIVNSHWPEFSAYTADRVCRHSGDGPFLLAAVPSVAWHAEQRKAIRETWGSVAYGMPWPGKQTNSWQSVKMVFVFGRSRTPEEDAVLHAEAVTYGDIVQADFEDNYGNLSLKTLTIVRWMTLHCPLAKHLMKVDEDTFVNIPLVLQLLTTLTSHNTRYITGFIYTSGPSKVQRQGKWAVPPRLYPAQYYPYYTVGHSYVISGDCVRDMTSACRHFHLLAIEDAFFTGILAKTLNITRFNCRLFASRFRKVEDCSVISGGYVSETLCNAERFRLLWTMLLKKKCHNTQSQNKEDRHIQNNDEI